MAEHDVQLTIPRWVEVSRRDVHLRVYRDKALFGTLKISRGSIDWSPAGSKPTKPHVVAWHEFDEFARSKRRGLRALSASAG